MPISLWPHLTVLTDYNFICPLIPGFYSIPCLIHSYGTTRTNMCTTPTPRLMNLWRILMPSPYNLLQTFLHNFIFKPIFSKTTTTFVTDKNYKISTYFYPTTLIINYKTKVWIKVDISLKTLRKAKQKYFDLKFRLTYCLPHPHSWSSHVLIRTSILSWCENLSTPLQC